MQLGLLTSMAKYTYCYTTLLRSCHWRDMLSINPINQPLSKDSFHIPTGLSIIKHCWLVNTITAWTIIVYWQALALRKMWWLFPRSFVPTPSNRADLSFASVRPSSHTSHYISLLEKFVLKSSEGKEKGEKGKDRYLVYWVGTGMLNWLWFNWCELNCLL